jgi:ABC-type multidrug transport system fused ATPase/permease subunit
VLIQIQGINSTMTDTAKESFTNIRTIRVFGREDAMLEQYGSAANERLKIGMKDAWYDDESLLFSICN